MLVVTRGGMGRTRRRVCGLVTSGRTRLSRDRTTKRKNFNGGRRRSDWLIAVKGSTEDESETVVSNNDVAEDKASTSSSDEDLAENAAGLLAKLVANPSSYLVAAVIVAFVSSQLKPNAFTVVLISALPVVGLTAISKTKVGEGIANKVEQEKQELLPLANQSEQERIELRVNEPKLQKYFGSERSKFLSSDSASHLKGVLPGDQGFDVLGLSRETETTAAVAEEESTSSSNWREGAYAGTRLGKFFEAELLHARWAMLGAIGCLIPEALSHYCGLADAIAEPIWWKVGYSVLHDGVEINYAGLQGFRIAGDKGVLAIAACQLVLMGGPEYARRVGIESLEPVGIFLPGDINYPGGQLFDPLNLSENPEEFLVQQVKEIKNGRLAMISMLGYAAQAVVTGKGPLENLEDFLSDPIHENVVAKLLFQH